MRFGKYLFMLVIVFLVACSDKIDSNMSEPMVDFEFITQDEEKLSSYDLEGNWWIANFMYTNCTMICPRTTANLIDVQQELKDSGLTPQIVSFSVDPSHDTPEVLKDYAKEYGVDMETWDFLTGYDFTTIQEISEGTFKTTLKEGAMEQRSHDFGFYLIAPDGEIVKKYDGMNFDELDMIMEDVKRVL
ncbi:SCO family protein [Virgibacillus sp. NKC19-3]|uniref:SCO family protein n=1 Tax=Virgibacillus saliphilus TaxID=2831674 RepID=UPI001C9ABF47|nr:SCO family protein [Virgibacillus sp. NKC19-3]MBY7144411.1 SCO family protein [Virgibacillus sp. NKC19-3]